VVDAFGAVPNDVADIWRPLSADEQGQVFNLLVKAAAMLQQKSPYIKARMARFALDPTDLGGLDPVLVATVVATMVKRLLVNVDGVVQETAGTVTAIWAIRGEIAVRGELHVTPGDLESLAPYRSKRSRVGSMKLHPSLAPRPFGNLGAATSSNSSYDSWLLRIGQDGAVSSEWPITSIPYAGDS